MTGRPEPSEADSYYFAYIDRVTGDDAIQELQSQMDKYVPTLTMISEKQSLHRYSPAKWSMRQLLNHVTDTERAFAFRALCFSRGFDTPLPSYDPDIAVAGANADATPWTAHVEEFRRVRLSTLSLFENLPAEAWMRSGVASGRLFTVRAIGFLIPGHACHHFEILRAKYLR